MVAYTVFQQMVSMFLIIAAAYVMSKAGLINSQISKGLSAILTTLGSPALVIRAMQIPCTRENIKVLGLAYGGMFFIVCIGIACGILFCVIGRVPLRKGGVYINSIAYPNTLYIGKPIIMALYGETAMFLVGAMILPFVILIFSAGSFCAQMGKGETGNKGRQFLKAICNVPFFGCMVALILFLFSIRLPEPVLDSFKMIGDTATPLSLIIIGHSLAKADLAYVFRIPKIYLLSFIRLLAVPVICLWIFSLWTRDPLVLGTMVLSAAMPTAALVSVISEENNDSPQLVSSQVLISTILGIFTVPLVTMMLGGI
jgi:hypothetical protein